MDKTSMSRLKDLWTPSQLRVSEDEYQDDWADELAADTSVGTSSDYQPTRSKDYRGRLNQVLDVVNKYPDTNRNQVAKAVKDAWSPATTYRDIDFLLERNSIREKRGGRLVANVNRVSLRNGENYNLKNYKSTRKSRSKSNTNYNDYVQSSPVVESASIEAFTYIKETGDNTVTGFIKWKEDKNE